MKSQSVFLASVICVSSCTVADSLPLSINIESIVRTSDGDYLLDFKINNPTDESVCTITDSFTLEKQGVWLLAGFGDDFIGGLDAGDSFDVSPNPYPGLSLKIFELTPESSFTSQYLMLQDGVPKDKAEQRLRIGLRYFNCSLANDGDLGREISVEEFDPDTGLLRTWNHGEVSVLISDWARLP